MFYVDNNSTRDVAISATARTRVPSALVEQLVKIEETMCLYPWYARVPSPSNPADKPSKPPAQIVFLFGWGSFSIGLPNSGDVGRCHG